MDLPYFKINTETSYLKIKLPLLCYSKVNLNI